MDLKIILNKVQNIKIIDRNFSKGFFLVFTLLLVSLITVSCLFMVNLTQTGKVSSDANVLTTNVTQLANQNIQAVAATLNVANNGIMKYLEDQKANIYFVTVSPTITTQCKLKPPSKNTTQPYSCSNPSVTNQFSMNIDNLNAHIFNNGNIVLNPKDPATSSTRNTIMPPTGITFPADQARIIQKNYSANGATATYTLNISQTVCSLDANGQTVCQAQNGDFEFTRTCPGSLNSNRSMRALTNTEIQSIGGIPPAGQLYNFDNSFPNLYCTCSDGNYPLTTSAGTCCGVRCLFDVVKGCYPPLGSGGSDFSKGYEGMYKDPADEICKPCITGCSVCNNGSTCLQCYQTNASNGYTLNRTTNTCQACGYDFGLNGYYNKLGSPIPDCPRCTSPCYYCFGPGQDKCIGCIAGHVRGGSRGSNCIACPSDTYAAFGDSSCKLNTSANCFQKSKTSNTCERCNRMGEAGILLEQDGYYLYEGDGQCYRCPEGKKIGFVSMERCQCPDGVNVSKDGVLFNGYRWLERKPYNDRTYWEDNCKG